MAGHEDSEQQQALEQELARLDDELSCLRAYRENTVNMLNALREKRERVKMENEELGSAMGPQVESTDEPSVPADVVEEQGLDRGFEQSADSTLESPPTLPPKGPYELEKARIYWLRVARGRQCVFALRDQAQLPAPIEHVRCAALYKGGCICVTDDGAVKTCGVPLKTALGGLLLLNKDPVRYIATSGFDDSQWYLLRSNGSYSCGKGVPRRLAERLAKGVVDFVAFGPNNGYFGRFENGRRFWSGESMSVRHFHPRLLVVFRSSHVLNLWMGPAKAFFVRYVGDNNEERTDWCGVPVEMKGYIKGGGCRQLLIDYDGTGRVPFLVRFSLSEAQIDQKHPPTAQESINSHAIKEK